MRLQGLGPSIQASVVAIHKYPFRAAAEVQPVKGSPGRMNMISAPL